MITRHKCPAQGCELLLPPRILMCNKHWHQVPRPLQNAVWAAWRSKNRLAHLTAVKAAIKSVNDAIAHHQI